MEKKKLEMLGKTVTLYKRPESDSIYFYFYHEGKLYKGSTGVKSFSDVKEIDMNIKVLNVLQGKPIKEVVKHTYTLEMAFKDFVKYKKGQSLGERTLYDINRYGKFILEFYGKKDVKTLGTSQMYLNYWNWKLHYYENNPSKRTITYTRKNGKVVNGITKKAEENKKSPIDNEINLLVMILHWCQEFGHIPREMYIDKHKNNRKEGNPTMVLSRADYMKIVDYLTIHNPFYCNIVRFVNNTGVRYPSEVYALQWKNIDFERRTISIEGRKRGNTTNRSRVDSLIPMTNRVKSILEELRKRQGIPIGENDFVFVNDKGNIIGNITKYWKKVLKRCDIDTGYTMYSLRHLFAVRLIKHGNISLKMISELLGHSTTAMIQSTYAQWIDINTKVKTLLQIEQTREDIIRNEMLNKLNELNGNTGE